MGAADVVIAVLVIAGACWILYRSLWKRGGCAGCSGGGRCSRERSAQQSQSQSQSQALVKLGSDRSGRGR
jgi:hypothetical protein